MCLGASNISFGLPNRHTLNAAFLPMANSAGLTSAIMNALSPECVTAAHASDLLMGNDPWGAELDRAVPLGGRRCRDRVGDVSVTDDIRVDESAGHDGRGRVVLRFAPMGVETRVPPGVNLFDAASWNGVAIDSTCGGHGTCKKCRVQHPRGGRRRSRASTRARSRRASCGTAGASPAARIATTDLAVEVPPMVTRPKAATVGVGRQVILRPSLQKRYLEMEEPTLAGSGLRPRARAARDRRPRRCASSLEVLRDLGTTSAHSRLQGHRGHLGRRADRGRARRHHRSRHGMAFDLGTTTVVATLLDLATGTPVAVASMLNKQQPFGADVITRISATMLDPDALGRLRDRAQETLAELAARGLREGWDRARGRCTRSRSPGNATMTQLVLGMDPEPLGVAPFIMSTRSFARCAPRISGSHCIRARRRYLFPALGAYVGGDIVAGILATGMTRDKRIRLFIDVGTNCEIVLGSAERVLTTAAPAGPAFEAAQIKCGMRAAEGAIETIKIDNGELKVGVIGDVGRSGAVRLGPGRRRAPSSSREGFIDESGRYLTEEAARALSPSLADRLVTRGEERVFVLAWKGEPGDVDDCVYLSQRDVRELQFAKAAIATGWKILVDELGVEVSDISQVLLAGSFGSYLSPASAVRIGLVPKLPVARIIAAGNVAGEGAKMVLLSAQERAQAMAVLEEVEYVELSGPRGLPGHVRRPAQVPPMTNRRRRLRRADAAHRRDRAPPRLGRSPCIRCRPPLHNRPALIAPAVDELLGELAERHDRLAVAYADCGSGGAHRRRLRAPRRRAPAGPALLRRARRAARAGAAGRGAGHVPADRLPRAHVRRARLARARARSLSRAARRLLPALPPRRLARPAADAPSCSAGAEHAAALLGLPLEVVETGELGLEAALADLVGTTNRNRA